MLEVFQDLFVDFVRMGGDDEKFKRGFASADDGVADKPISDWDGYRASLRSRMAKYWQD